MHLFAVNHLRFKSYTPAVLFDLPRKQWCPPLAAPPLSSCSSSSRLCSQRSITQMGNYKAIRVTRASQSSASTLTQGTRSRAQYLSHYYGARVVHSESRIWQEYGVGNAVGGMPHNAEWPDQISRRRRPQRWIEYIHCGTKRRVQKALGLAASVLQVCRVRIRILRARRAKL